jgi:hypothetical protein
VISLEPIIWPAKSFAWSALEAVLGNPETQARRWSAPFDHVDTSLQTSVEVALSTTTGKDLSLDNKLVCPCRDGKSLSRQEKWWVATKAFRDLIGLLGCMCCDAFWRRNTVLVESMFNEKTNSSGISTYGVEQFHGLVFMDGQMPSLTRRYALQPLVSIFGRQNLSGMHTLAKGRERLIKENM